MKCVILQPSYIPWRGYFHQIKEADTFVFYDDVQYDARGWRNRNRIRGPNGTFWLTIPIRSKNTRSRNSKINEIEIDWTRNWSERHLKSLAASYGKAPYFEAYHDLLNCFYSRRDRLLVDLLIDFTVALSRELGIHETEFVRSSSLGVVGGRNDRLMKIALKLGADHYITGPSAKSYLDVARFLNSHIEVEFFKYEYPPYAQLFEGFEPQVSILDLLFMKGKEASEYIW